MRFNSEAYDKLYPRKKEKEVIESAVETFTPTSDEQDEEDTVVEKIVETVEN